HAVRGEDLQLSFVGVGELARVGRRTPCAETQVVEDDVVRPPGAALRRELGSDDAFGVDRHECGVTAVASRVTGRWWTRRRRTCRSRSLPWRQTYVRPRGATIHRTGECARPGGRRQDENPRYGNRVMTILRPGDGLDAPGDLASPPQ